MPSKGATLEFLAPRVTLARILPLIRVPVTTWQVCRDQVLAAVAGTDWADGPVIVRSSAAVEDGAEWSRAGEFLSVPHVIGSVQLIAAIEAVVASMAGTPDPADEVIVQPMLGGVVASGVIFTADPATGGPYYLVEWTEGAGTSEVTSGARGEHRLHVHLRSCPRETAPALVASVIEAVAEVERVLAHDGAIDVEFAVLPGDDVVLLQARPLRTPPLVPAAALGPLLRSGMDDLDREERAGVFTGGPVLSRMSDWNPAEMIGTRPRALALSLYQALITDETWAVSRARYGFRQPVDPLMVELLGQPYIDVAVSLRSFVPEPVDAEAADRLVEVYLHRLLSDLSMHDKLEFDVAVTSYPLDIDQRFDDLRSWGACDRDLALLRAGLHACVLRVLDPRGPWAQDLRAAGLLANGFRAGPAPRSLRAALRELVLVRRQASLPFAGLARAAFMVTDLVSSLQRLSPPVFAAEEFTAVLASPLTIASTIRNDLHGKSPADFLARHGHLRPGMYNILTPRYRDAPETYLASVPSPESGDGAPVVQVSPAQRRRIGAALAAAELPLDADTLLRFLRRAVAARERGKYVLARRISDLLEAFRKVGGDLGLDADDLSHLPVAALRRASLMRGGVAAYLADEVAAGRGRHEQWRAVRLPDVVTSPSQLLSHTTGLARPSFVTGRQVTGAPADPGTVPLADRIVFLEAADPGYDYLFAHGIAGLVTTYGGPNSHMAIRANELSLPAVIGAGQLLYDRWRRARLLFLDCAAGQVQVLA